VDIFDNPHVFRI